MLCQIASPSSIHLSCVPTLVTPIPPSKFLHLISLAQLQLALSEYRFDVTHNCLVNDSLPIPIPSVSLLTAPSLYPLLICCLKLLLASFFCSISPGPSDRTPTLLWYQIELREATLRTSPSSFHPVATSAVAGNYPDKWGLYVCEISKSETWRNCNQQQNSVATGHTRIAN